MNGHPICLFKLMRLRLARMQMCDLNNDRVGRCHSIVVTITESLRILSSQSFNKMLQDNGQPLIVFLDKIARNLL